MNYLMYTEISLGGKAAAGFVERCVSFIGENAAECVRTNSFLSLPKEAVIKLISSDYVSIPPISACPPRNRI